MKDVICPYCNTHLLLSKEIEKVEFLKCSGCNKDFQNPLVQIKSVNPNIWSKILIGLGVLLIAYFSFKGGENKEKVYNSEYDGSVHQVERYLKSTYLKDPDSYQSIKWSKVMDMKHNNYGYRYKVMHKYKASNSFGAIIIESKIFFLDNEGKVVDISNDDNLYNSLEATKSSQNKSFAEQMEKYQKDNDWGE
tara:strand:+ start:2163 stop:2738 length:576 start_codon:yes stop_codon:yes gene_type:complete